MPAGEVAGADVIHLALPNQGRERLPELTPVSAPVDVVHLVEIDLIDPETPQAPLGVTHDLHGGEAAAVVVGLGSFALLVGPVVDFGGQYDGQLRDGLQGLGITFIIVGLMSVAEGTSWYLRRRK